VYERYIFHNGNFRISADSVEKAFRDKYSIVAVKELCPANPEAQVVFDDSKDPPAGLYGQLKGTGRDIFSAECQHDFFKSTGS